MATFTLAQLRLKARERADMVNSRFVSETELTGFINASVAELYDLLIATRGENYYVDEYLITTTSNTKSYALPDTFLKLMGVDWVLNSTESFNLKEFMWSERNLYNNPLNFNGYFGNTRYQIRGNNIVFSPVPTGSQQINLWFIPKSVTLVADADTLNGFNGWEEYVVIDAAIKMRVKEESPVQELLIAKQDMKSRIQQASSGRVSAEPPRIQDVESGFRNLPY